MNWSIMDVIASGKRYLLILMVFTVTGCVVTSEVNMIPPLSEDVFVDGNKGYVALRVINAGGSQLTYNYLTITPKDLNDSEENLKTRLQSVARVGGTSTFFFSAVNPGEYSLANIRSYHTNGTYWYDRWAASDVGMGTFRVEPGRLTDLGTIVYYPKPEEDVYVNTLLRTPSQNNSDLIAAFFPFFQGTEQEPLTWNEDDLDEDRLSLYLSVVQNPISYNFRYLAPSNSLYFVGKLGTLLKRDASFEWHIDAVDTDADLQAVAENSYGDLVVGGDYGSVFFKPQGGEWQKQKIDTAYSVEAIAFYEEHMIDVVMRNADEIVISRGDSRLPNPSWKRMAVFQPYKGWMNAEGEPYGPGASTPQTYASPKIISHVSIQEIDSVNHLFLSVENGEDFSVFNSRSQQKFIYDAANWTMQDSPDFDSGIDYIMDAGAVQLGVKRPGFFSWDGLEDYYRKTNETGDWQKMSTTMDNCSTSKIESSVLDRKVQFCMIDGKKVRRRQAFEFVSVPIFKDQNNAFSVVKFSVSSLFNNNPSSEWAIAETKDGGKTWQRSDKKLPREYCLRTVPEAKDVLLLSCQGISSDFFQSVDDGETWEHVRQHEDF